MKDFNCYVLVFDSTHQALSAERALKDCDIGHSIINTPREFSVDCGISIRIDRSLKERAVELLESRGVVYAGVEPYYSRFI